MTDSDLALAVVPTLRGRPEELARLTAALRDLQLTPVLVVNGRRLHESLEAQGVAHLPTNSNAGFGASVRAGLETEPGWRWLAIVNDDVHIEPGTVEPHVARVLGQDWREPYLGYLDPGPVLPIPTMGSVFTSVSLLSAISRRLAGADPGPDIDRGYKSFSFVIISRGLWDALGGLDERLIHTYEDSDFAARARRAGAVIEALDSAGITHVGSSTGKKHVDRVLPVGVYSAEQYLRSIGVRAVVAKGVLAAALVVRLLFVPVVNADRRSHVRGIRDALRTVILGRRPSLPAYEES